MVKKDFIFTEVRAGHERIVMERGEYKKTLKPGWNLIGLPGMHELLRRDLEFKELVAMEDGEFNAISHIDKGVTEFKTTEYPYAHPFARQEDNMGLPLSGIIAVHGVVEDNVLAMVYIVRWYVKVTACVMQVWRDVVLADLNWEQIVGDNSAEDKKKARVSVTQSLWKALNDKSLGEFEGKPESPLEELRRTTGFKILKVDVVTIDPPEGWRPKTLERYAAKKEKEAAIERAEASAARMDDTNQAFEKWLKKQKELVDGGSRGPVTDAEIAAKQKEYRDRVLAAEPGYQQVDIRGVEGAQTIALGGNNGLMFSDRSGGGKGGGQSGGGKGNNPSPNPGGPAPDPKPTLADFPGNPAGFAAATKEWEKRNPGKK